MLKNQRLLHSINRSDNGSKFGLHYTTRFFSLCIKLVLIYYHSHSIYGGMHMHDAPL